MIGNEEDVHGIVQLSFFTISSTRLRFEVGKTYGHSPREGFQRYTACLCNPSRPVCLHSTSAYLVPVIGGISGLEPRMQIERK